MPPKVTSQHDEAAEPRHVLTASERDQRDLLLAIRRDQLLARLRIAGLPPGSAVADLLAGKIREAISEHRLGEVADLLDSVLATTGPAAIEGDVVDGEVISDTDADADQDDDDGETYIMVDGRPVLAEWTGDGRLVPAVPGPPRLSPVARLALPSGRGPLAWTDCLETLGWRLGGFPGGCQVTEAGRACGAADAPYVITDRYGRPASVCWQHKEPLTLMMNASRRPA